MAVFLSHYENELVYFSLLPFGYLLFHMRKVLATSDPKEFDPELKFVALSTFGLSVLFFVTVILVFSNASV